MSGPNATVWAPGIQEGEYTGGTAQGLVDASSVGLVDASGVSLADDGTVYTPVAQTTWSVNETG